MLVIVFKLFIGVWTEKQHIGTMYRHTIINYATTKLTPTQFQYHGYPDERSPYRLTIYLTI